MEKGGFRVFSKGVGPEGKRGVSLGGEGTGPHIGGRRGLSYVVETRAVPTRT